MPKDEVYETALSLMSVWVLAALGVGACHIYGLEGRIYGLSMATLTPGVGSIRRTVTSLERRGLVHVVAEEPGRASGYVRRIYALTEKGWLALRVERRRIEYAGQAIDKALAEQLVRS